MRVVSVLPSATEIVFALGHGAELVGRSAECDYPVEARTLPVVMHPRAGDQDRPSGEIDARVRSVRSTGASLYTLDVERLRTLRPDLILTQDLCGVCSVTDREVEEACALAGVRPYVVSLTPRRLEDVWQSIATIASALRDPGAGDRMVEGIRNRVPRPSPDGTTRVAVVEWLDPPILAGLWTPDIVRSAGAYPVGPEPGAEGQRTTWAELADLRPELLILSPCSFSVARSRQELADGRIAAGVRSVAPPRGTFVADEAYFSRPGPRLADGVELVRSLLRGDASEYPMPVDRWQESSAEASA